MRSRIAKYTALALAIGFGPTPALAQDRQVFDDVMGIYGTWAYIDALMDECFKVGNSEAAYEEAATEWQKRNQPFRDAADQALEKLGGDEDGMREQTEAHAVQNLLGTAEAQANPLRYCQTARANLNSGAFDLDKIYVDALARIRTKAAG